jgi:hypothetical protein
MPGRMGGLLRTTRSLQIIKVPIIIKLINIILYYIILYYIILYYIIKYYNAWKNGWIIKNN